MLVGLLPQDLAHDGHHPIKLLYLPHVPKDASSVRLTYRSTNQAPKTKKEIPTESCVERLGGAHELEEEQDA